MYIKDLLNSKGCTTPPCGYSYHKINHLQHFKENRILFFNFFFKTFLNQTRAVHQSAHVVSITVPKKAKWHQ